MNHHMHNNHQNRARARRRRAAAHGQQQQQQQQNAGRVGAAQPVDHKRPQASWTKIWNFSDKKGKNVKIMNPKPKNSV